MVYCVNLVECLSFCSLKAYLNPKVISNRKFILQNHLLGFIVSASVFKTLVKLLCNCSNLRLQSPENWFTCSFLSSHPQACIQPVATTTCVRMDVIWLNLQRNPDVSEKDHYLKEDCAKCGWLDMGMFMVDPVGEKTIENVDGLVLAL